MQGRRLRNYLRFIRWAHRRVDERLLEHRRRQQAAALSAKRKQPSRRERHLARVAEGEARRAELRQAEADFAAQRPEFLP